MRSTEFRTAAGRENGRSAPSVIRLHGSRSSRTSILGRYVTLALLGAALSAVLPASAGASTSPSLQGAPVGLTNSTSASISWEPGDGFATQSFRCSIDRGSWFDCDSQPVDLSDLSDGRHSFALIQYDGYGDQVGDVAQAVWEVDATAPDPPSLPAAVTTGDWSIGIDFTPAEAGGTLECAIDGGEFTSCTTPLIAYAYVDGEHNVAIRQIDDAGNIGAEAVYTWILDTTAPNAPILSGAPTGRTQQTEATIGFSLAEPDGTVECRVDNGSWGACTSVDGTSGTHSTTGLSDGPHTISVRQSDSVGNVGEAATTDEWTVDTTAPAPPSLAGPPPSTDAEASIGFSGEDGASFSCRLDDGEWSDCGASPKALSDLSVGIHSLSIKQSDSVGNESDVASVDVVRLPGAVTQVGDGYAGTLRPNQGQASGSALLEWTWTGGLFDFLNGASADTSSSSSGNGSGSIGVDASSPSGSAEVVSCLDADRVYCGPSALLSFYADVDPSYAIGDCSDPAQADVPDTTCDFTAPGVATFDGLTDGNGKSLSNGETTNSTAIHVAFNSSESNPQPHCKLVDGDSNDISGQDWESCTVGGYDLTTPADGSYRLLVRITDGNGNTSETATSDSWSVDTTAPDAPGISSPTDGGTIASNSVTFAASKEPGASLKCGLDSGDWADCPTAAGATPGDRSRIGVGWNTILHWGEASDWTDMQWGQTNPNGTVQWNGLRYRSDFTASFGSDAVTAERIIHLFMPSLSCSYVEGLGSSTGLFIVAGTHDQSEWNSFGLDCANNSMAEVPTPTPARFTDLANGQHTLSVLQEDAVGNRSDPATVTWTVDTIAPAAPELSGTPSGATKETSASVQFTLAEDGGTVECRLDSGPWGDCTSRVDGVGVEGSFEVSDLAEGSHTISVRQTDSVGNVSDAATSDPWTVDTTAPATPELIGTPNALTNSTSASIGITGEDGAAFECSFDDEPFESCTSPWTANNVGEGDHSLRVHQTDAGGNTSPDAQATWTVVQLKVEADPSLSVGFDPPVRVGTTITGGGQRFAGSPGLASEVYRWQRCSGPSASLCSPITGATSTSYVAAAADVGKRLRLTVTHTTVEGTNITAKSPASGIVMPVAGGPSSIAFPTGATGPVYGRKLTAVEPNWSGGLPTGIAIQYRWQRCFSSASDTNTSSCASNLSQTGPTYTVGSADVGKRIRLLVGVQASGLYVWAASAVSPLVTVRPVNTSPPTIALPSGAPSPRRLMRLQGDQGAWSYTYGGKFTWAWQSCTGTDDSTCSTLTGKTLSLFIPGTAQVGKRLRAAVTYRSPDGRLTTAFTAISEPVRP